MRKLLFALAAVVLLGAAAPPSKPPIAGTWREEMNGAPRCCLTFRGVGAGTLAYACPGRKTETRRWTLRGRQLVIRTKGGDYITRYERVDEDRFHAELYPEGGRRWSDLIREKP